MEAKEAAECAEIIGTKSCVPIHMLPRHLFSEEKAAEFNTTGKLVIRPAEEIEL